VFQRAIVRPPGDNFADGLTSFQGPRPNIEIALKQHQAYCAALESCGLHVLRLEPDLAHPDSTFVEDVAVLIPHAAVITRPGAESRVGEVNGIRKPLQKFFNTIHEIVAPGTLDGGDVCSAGKHFFIGVSQRTNEAGAHQLATILAQYDYTGSLVDIRAIPGALHLKSALASLDDGQLVITDDLAGRAEFRGYQVIHVPGKESYAANCVYVNEYVLIPEGFPRLATTLRSSGFKLLLLDVSEFRKMDGGLSCLSLRF
jgi:dimethylargininase